MVGHVEHFPPQLQTAGGAEPEVSHQTGIHIEVAGPLERVASEVAESVTAVGVARYDERGCSEPSVGPRVGRTRIANEIGAPVAARHAEEGRGIRHRYVE